MGQEIDSTRFKHRDFQRFRQRLHEESNLLGRWIADEALSRRRSIGGFELEAWLVDRHTAMPSPTNEAFLQHLANPLVVPELAKFNVELNVSPQALADGGIHRLHRDLAQTWENCIQTAAAMDLTLMAIGILPTVTDVELAQRNMSQMKRYKALNEQVLRSRQGLPMTLDITGHEHLRSTHKNVMLESAATSFQLHLQVPLNEARRFYNASIAISAPMVAVAANAPFLFGRDLWADTRIPVFEQAVEVGGYHGASHGPVRRVTFGSGYAQESILECFAENEAHYPVLLPMHFDTEPAMLQHLRLHNGTIWRWNRPLIGFDDDGTPHLRIEHRVMSAGPTVEDELANAVFFFGLMEWHGLHEVPIEHRIPFTTARDNFYSAARLGLEAPITWSNGKRVNVTQLILQELIPAASLGLEKLGVDAALAEQYLDIVRTRTSNHCNGAAWQRAFVAKHGRNMQQLALAYVERQQSGEPVHCWDM